MAQELSLHCIQLGKLKLRCRAWRSFNISIPLLAFPFQNNQDRISSFPNNLLFQVTFVYHTIPIHTTVSMHESSFSTLICQTFKIINSMSTFNKVLTYKLLPQTYAYTPALHTPTHTHNYTHKYRVYSCDLTKSL